jgi:hypothetical protein
MSVYETLTLLGAVIVFTGGVLFVVLKNKFEAIFVSKKDCVIKHLNDKSLNEAMHIATRSFRDELIHRVDKLETKIDGLTEHIIILSKK